MTRKKDLIAVYVSSSDSTKIKPVIQAFNRLGISNYLLQVMDEKPTNESLKKNSLLEVAKDHNLQMLGKLNEEKRHFDYLISIENGFEQEEENYYLVSYAVCLNKKGEQNIGKSLSIPITKKMYEYFISGKSLNCLIKAITNNKDNKQENSIPNFLSRGLLFKLDSDVEAVITSLLPFVNHQEYENLGIQMSKKQD